MKAYLPNHSNKIYLIHLPSHNEHTANWLLAHVHAAIVTEGECAKQKKKTWRKKEGQVTKFNTKKNK